MSKKIKVSRHRTIWLDRGWQPSYIGFCPSEKAWRRMLRHLNIDESYPYPTTDGGTSTFEKDGKITLIITINNAEKVAPLSVIGLIVHECQHVWREIKENMGEHAPGSEQEAYALQILTQQCVDAFERTRHSLVRKIK